ncbi:acyl-CoA dehydrogenase family protein [Streptomyces sp. DSM 44915]|uniref:Acyl-CoA dehydrogenase family protein n=1 Tax=Streptomyces chisholmiae TaxID=3075540 RepID=A0ABU2JRK2_9ACTN|nr:acyl-CoA dehydrogenase family protein [Streptomyces sp. DSM 44915]MDT0267373.1 acyl-CoA dehydrogenase family protein [Streptomyces sp. DSM 44915]
MTTALRDALPECERLARQEGLAAGLAAAVADTEVAATAPGRYAAVPEAGLSADAPVRRHRLADHEGVVFLATPGTAPHPPAALVDVGRRLAAARIGLVRRLLDQAVEHLTGRVSGDEPLIRKQLVTGAIADALTEIELLRVQVHGQDDPGALADAHDRLDDLGWEVLKLFGAAGYIADHPARALHVSVLVGNTWVVRDGGQP